MSMEYLHRVNEASSVYILAKRTPLEYGQLLSSHLGHHLYYKREDLQSVFSFKIRGALNKIAHLSEATRARGIITASAGNHAQGVAAAAQYYQVSALIVMPVTTPRIKVNAVERLNGKIVQYGESFSDAYQHALVLAKSEGLTFVHPFDDPEVIAGQGTIGKEIIEQFATLAAQRPDVVFCPVGGGGLIAGVASYFKACCPQTRIIGVESVDANAMACSLKADSRVVLEQIGLFADGTAVKQVGVENFRLCQQFVDGIVQVTTDEVCAGIKDFFAETRVSLEPSGALSIAGAKRWLNKQSGEALHVVAITSGANLNFDRLRFVAERAEVGECREALFAVTMPEEPGSYCKFINLLGDRNITEFNYRYSDDQQAQVYVGLQIEHKDETDRLVEQFHNHSFDAMNLTNDEIAQEHIRYMIGGLGLGAENERLFRFMFPEKPGALRRFLDVMSNSWNISLFHYRNHGADYGRVLVGIQVPDNHDTKFSDFLDKVGYEYLEVTHNKAYQKFLRPR